MVLLVTDGQPIGHWHDDVDLFRLFTAKTRIHFGFSFIYKFGNPSED